MYPDALDVVARSHGGKRDISSASPQRASHMIHIPKHDHKHDHKQSWKQERGSAKTHILMSLSILPAELIEQIASYLDLTTFRILRLTCSRLRSDTVHVFKQRFFATQYLAWTKSSLQRLVDILQHNGLGNALRYLIIDATPFYSLQLWKMRRRSADAGHMTPITDDEDGSKLIQRLDKEFEELQEEANEVAKWFNETRFDIKCLTTVFAKLKGARSLESVEFVYEGMEARYSKFTRRYCEASQHEMSRPFVSTMSAIAASGVRVKHITIHPQHSHGSISIGRLESLAHVLLSFTPTLERLETLQLNLRDWRAPDLGFELERTRAPFVIRFLAKCSNVGVLELSCYSDFEEDLFGEMARECVFGRVEVLRLETWRICRAGDLLMFLKPMKKLRQLRLQHILLADAERTWTDLFTSIAESNTCFEALESLEVKRLFTQRGPRRLKVIFTYIEGKLTSSSLQVEGLEWRNELRSRGCKYGECESLRMWVVDATLYPFAGVSLRPRP